MFSYAIMGAGGISAKFCDAVRRIPDCRVVAVSSKSLERAETFAKREGIPAAYGSYTEMLEREKPDCVYIGADTGSHFRLTMLCLEHGVPVLCEKAMFCTSEDARAAIEKSRQSGMFMMEAMWSYFLPAIKTAKSWADGGRIGRIYRSECALGFKASDHPGNRYFNTSLGGGAAYDLGVYAYDLTTLMLGHDYEEISVSVLKHESGVDGFDQFTARYKDCISSMTASIIGPLEERLILYGEKGRIIVPSSHFASRAILLDEKGNVADEFIDRKTENGFVYEVKEAMDCVLAGKTESDTVPHRLTLETAGIYDIVNEKLRKM